MRYDCTNPLQGNAKGQSKYRLSYVRSDILIGPWWDRRLACLMDFWLQEQ